MKKETIFIPALILGIVFGAALSLPAEKDGGKVSLGAGNILARKAFSVSIPSAKFVAETAYVGTVSGRDVDKFAITSLTPVRCEYVDAPYVKEFPLAVECKVIKTIELGIHTMFIGKIMDVKADKAILGKRNRPDIKKMNPFIFSQGDFGFYTIGDFLGTIKPLAEKVSPPSKKR